MKIDRNLALKILKYLLINSNFYFPFKVMCRDYGEDDDYVEMIAQDDYEGLLEDESYQDFELWEDLQNIDLTTIQLMSKGFIEKITNTNAINEIQTQLTDYRGYYKEELTQSEDIEIYGDNEFCGGLIRAYEDCLTILSK